MRTVLQDRYYSLERANERYMIQTRSQTKASGVQLSEVHGVKKGLNPHKKPEKQPHPIVRLIIDKKSTLGQGRTGIGRKVKLAPPSETQKNREDIIGLKVPSSQPIAGNDEAAQVVSPVLPTSLAEILRSELPSYILPERRPPPKHPDQSIERRERS